MYEDVARRGTPEGTSEWYGKVQHVLKADVATFRGFMALADLPGAVAANSKAQEGSTNEAHK